MTFELLQTKLSFAEISTKVCLKCVFLGKKYKNLLSVRGSTLEPPFASNNWGFRTQTLALLLPPTITPLYSSILTLNAFYSPSKKK